MHASRQKHDELVEKVASAIGGKVLFTTISCFHRWLQNVEHQFFCEQRQAWNCKYCHHDPSKQLRQTMTFPISMLLQSNLKTQINLPIYRNFMFKVCFSTPEFNFYLLLRFFCCNSDKAWQPDKKQRTVVLLNFQNKKNLFHNFWKPEFSIEHISIFIQSITCSTFLKRSVFPTWKKKAWTPTLSNFPLRWSNFSRVLSWFHSLFLLCIIVFTLFAQFEIKPSFVLGGSLYFNRCWASWF